MPRIVTDSRPISAQHPVTEFYRQEFVKHHRCLQHHRPYYSETAITDVEAALQKGPSSDAVNRLFLIRLRSGEPADQAVAFLRDWLARYPQDNQVRFQLSSYMIENGRLPEAIVETEELLRRDPNNAMTLNNLAWLYNEKKDPRARELAERAFKQAPDAPAVMDT